MFEWTANNKLSLDIKTFKLNNAEQIVISGKLCFEVLMTYLYTVQYYASSVLTIGT